MSDSIIWKAKDSVFLQTNNQIPTICKFSENEIYVGSISGEINVYHSSGNHLSKPAISVHCMAVSSIAVSDIAKLVVSTSSDGCCIVSDANTHQKIREISCENLVFPKCAINRIGTVVAVVGFDGSLLIEKETVLLEQKTYELITKKNFR